MITLTAFVLLGWAAFAGVRLVSRALAPVAERESAGPASQMAR